MFLVRCAKIHVHEIHTHRINSLACSLHDVHYARCVPNSLNSAGDGIVRGRGVCIPGETKPSSTSTRCGVRRSAVDEYTHPQLTPLKFHDEMWAGILRNQGLGISQEVESRTGVCNYVWLVFHVLITILSHLGQA